VEDGVRLAVVDSDLRESIGIGAPGDISVGGLRVRNLPVAHVKVGDQLEMLLMDQEEALELHGEVVHHGTPDTFGVEFRALTRAEHVAVSGIIDRLQR